MVGIPKDNSTNTGSGRYTTGVSGQLATDGRYKGYSPTQTRSNQKGAEGRYSKNPEVASGRYNTNPNTENRSNEVVQTQLEENNNTEKKPGFFTLTTWNMALTIQRLLVLLVVVGLIAAGVWWMLSNKKTDNIDGSRTGAVSLEGYIDAVNGGTPEGITKALGEPSYVAQEFDYVANHEIRVSFVKTTLSQVSVNIPDVKKVDSDGEVVTDDKDNPVIEKDNLMSGGSVTYTLPDYTQVQMTPESVKGYIEANNIKTTSNIDITNAYAGYMVEAYSKGLVGKREVERVPDITISEETKEDGKTVKYGVLSANEDIWLDQELFSSPEFWELQDTFSEYALGGNLKKTDEYESWESATGQGVSEIPEPGPSASGQTPSAPAQEPSASAQEPKPSASATDPGQSTATPEMDGLGGGGVPDQTVIPKDLKDRPAVKWDSVVACDREWIGSYYLTNVISGGDKSKIVEPEQGTGTKEDPAGQNTTVKTKIANDKGEFVDVELTLITVKRDEEAFSIFAEKDNRNRGFTTKSMVKYMYLEFEVVNTGTKDITVSDRSTLATSDGNPNRRTGTIYGLKETITLKPGESGVLEVWVASTNIDSQYFIWKGYPNEDKTKHVSDIWFRLLAGDPDNIAPTETANPEEPLNINP